MPSPTDLRLPTRSVLQREVVQRCENCQRAKTVMFFSAECAHCNSPMKGKFCRGYICFHPSFLGKNGELPEGPSFIVFRTIGDALTYRDVMHSYPEEYEIRLVLSEYQIPWRVMSGAAAGLIGSSIGYRLYPNHKFAPDFGKAVLMPKDHPNPPYEQVIL